MCTLTGWMLLRKDMLSSLSLSDSCPKLFDRSRGSTNIAGPRQRSGALAAPTISQALSHHHHRHRRGNRRLIDTCPLSRKVQSAMSGTRFQDTARAGGDPTSRQISCREQTFQGVDTVHNSPPPVTQGNFLSLHTFLNLGRARERCPVENEWMAWNGAAVQPFSR